MAINLHVSEYPIYSFGISGSAGNKQLLISAPPGDFLNDADMDAFMVQLKELLLGRDDVDAVPLVKYDETSRSL